MRKLTKIMLPEVGVGDLKIRPRGDNRCESAKLTMSGSVAFPASLTPVLVAITWSGVMYVWNSWHTLVFIIGEIFGLGLFIFYEARFAKYILLSLHILTNQNTNIAYFLIWIHGIIL